MTDRDAERVAFAAGVSPRTVWRYLANPRSVSEPNAVAIAMALGRLGVR